MAAVDFSVTFAVNHIQAIDRGAPITILAGVHAGCYELFAREGIGSITELKGKQVGLQTGSPALLKLMAAQVGLDPEKDFQWVIDPKSSRSTCSRRARSMPSSGSRPSPRNCAPVMPVT